MALLLVALIAAPAVRGENPVAPGGIIVLDPGHGGGDVGVRSGGGLLEKDLTLALAAGLKEKLEVNLGVKVILTRSGDYEVTHLERAAMAGHNKAALFVSLHVGAAASQAADNFIACYAVPRVSPGGGGSVIWQVWNEQNSPFRDESKRLAAALQAGLSGWLSREPGEPCGGDWVVLKGVGCPAALVELGCLSNPERGRAYEEKSSQDDLTRVLYNAVAVYLDSHG